jgi:hypothetical protein
MGMAAPPLRDDVAFASAAARATEESFAAISREIARLGDIGLDAAAPGAAATFVSFGGRRGAKIGGSGSSRCSVFVV